MKILTILFALVASSCAAPEQSTPLVVTFQQLLDAPKSFDGKTVRLSCTISLFGEGVQFTKSGMTPKFDCDVIHFEGHDEWGHADLIGDARLAYDKFRKEHSELRWPAVEAEVEIVAVFDIPRKNIESFFLRPVRLLRYKLSRMTALEPDPLSSTLLFFPIEGTEKKPNKALVPTVMSVTPAADAPVAPATTAAHL
jgi:hypothetical protein